MCVHSAMHLKLNCYSQPALLSTLALSLAVSRYAAARVPQWGLPSTVRRSLIT